MNYVLGLLFVLFILLIIWLPTLIALFIKKNTVKEGAWILFCEVLWIVSLTVLADICGLTNPAGYILVSIIIVSVGGFFYVLRRRKKLKQI